MITAATSSFTGHTYEQWSWQPGTCRGPQVLGAAPDLLCSVGKGCSHKLPRACSCCHRAAARAEFGWLIYCKEHARPIQPLRCKVSFSHHGANSLLQRCADTAIALHRRWGKIPNCSRLSGTSFVFVVVMNGPPHDSHGEDIAQLLPLLCGSGWVAFDNESLWVLPTHAFVASSTKDGSLDGVSLFCCYSPFGSVTLSLGCCRSIGCSQMALRSVFKTSLLALLGAEQLCLEVICDLGHTETASVSLSCLHHHSFVPRASTHPATSR